MREKKNTPPSTAKEEPVRINGNRNDNHNDNNNNNDTDNFINMNGGDTTMTPTTTSAPLENPQVQQQSSLKAPSGGAGAQILMNRFSTWKQKANQNAQALLKKAETITNDKKPLSFRSLVVDGATPFNDNAEIEPSTSGGSSPSGSGSSYSSSSNSSVSDGESSLGNTTPTTAKPTLPTTINTEKTKEKLRKTAATASTIANQVVDSVATGFRGRYTHTNSNSHHDALPNTNQQAPAAAGINTAVAFIQQQKNNITLQPQTQHQQTQQSQSTIINSNNPTSMILPQRLPKKESQTSLILKSRAASYMQQILSSLQDHEYVMLLGNGMLGVNLKQCYLKNHGVYVDYLVNGGAAQKSGVIYVGDRLIKVADIDVRKGTISTVPSIIAQTKRPAVLVLTTGTKPKKDIEIQYINYVDIVVAMMHNILTQDKISQNKQQMRLIIKSSPTITHAVDAEDGSFSPTRNNDNDDEPTNHYDPATTMSPSSPPKAKAVGFQDEIIIEDDSSPLKTTGGSNNRQHHYVDSNHDIFHDDAEMVVVSDDEFGGVIPTEDSIESYVNPPQPPFQVQKAFLSLVGKRCNDNFSISRLSQAVASNKNFRAALRNAFLACAIDNRKFPYLGRHFSMEKIIDDDNKNSEGRGEKATTPSALLMLFLELMNFADFHGVTPNNRLRDIASRIAHKFFLPTKVANNRLEPPMFDFHHIVRDSSLRKLETALRNMDTVIPRDIFFDFQQAVVDSLSGSNFLLFLVSNECARMRCSLRNTAPYVNVNLRKVFDALVTTNNDANAAATNIIPHAGAKNYFLFIIIYLLTQVDKEPYGENETIYDNNGKNDQQQNRIIGSANGICCSLFIHRHIMPISKKLNKNVQMQQQQKDKEDDKLLCAALIEAYEHLWEVFVAPGIGSLDQLVKSGETDIALKALRSHLLKIKQSCSNQLSSNNNTQQKQRSINIIAEQLLDEKLFDETKLLADQLLYDYASNNHTKFREHKFHEWMCSELAKEKASLTSKGTGNNISNDNKITTIDENNDDDGLPNLASGCIKRLLRKVNLPVGLSSHKPLYTSSKIKKSSSKTDSIRNEKSTKGMTGYPNAELAFVFGTSVGLDLAVQMSSPAIDHHQSDIRRYVCQDVTPKNNDDDKNKTNDSNDLSPNGIEERFIAPTLESYAMLPRTRATPFSKVTGNICSSSDGWEVSLLNFMIPNADTGGPEDTENPEESALYGVSLVFQRSAPIGYLPRKKTIHQTQLIDKHSANGRNDSSSTKTDGEGKGSTDNTGTESESEKGDANKKHNKYEKEEFRSPLSFQKHNCEPAGKILSGAEGSLPSEYIRHVEVSGKVPTFNKRLQERAWADRISDDESRDKNAPMTIGIALVSQRNVIFAMRETLSKLLRDYSRLPEEGANDDGGDGDNEFVYDDINTNPNISCGALANLLGNFAHQDVESISLKYILEPYLQQACSPWLDRPLLDQKDEFERLAGQQLVRSLPPIPLALMFVTALLEQKIVLSSSRRSVLFSASMALTCMLQPLKWCHLLVPLVPSALARDLLQYPAPFILGMPSEDPGIMELLNNLPKDVTLVDLDVGRVILASSFVHDIDRGTGGKQASAVAASALRSQVLYLAQLLGSDFGTKLFPEAWSCDSPLMIYGSSGANSNFNNAHNTSNNNTGKFQCEFDILRSVCKSFLCEVVSGISSCLYWVEEAVSNNDSSVKNECTVIFDEDRFFHIKNYREKHGFCPLFSLEQNEKEHQKTFSSRHELLTLSLDDFDLIFESLLRCQSMSWYISSLKTKTQESTNNTSESNNLNQRMAFDL